MKWMLFDVDIIELSSRWSDHASNPAVYVVGVYFVMSKLTF